MAHGPRVIERILQVVLPVFGIVAAGWVYGRTTRQREVAVVNRMNMDVFVPALILGALTSAAFDLRANAALIAGAAAVVMGSGVLAWPVARWLGVDVRTFLPTAMFNNCGNMGLPLALLAFGAQNLPAAVAMFVTSNLIQFTLGVALVRRGAPVGRMLVSPMVVVTVAGVTMKAAGWTFPEVVAVALKMLGDVALPLMLFTLGVRMAFTPLVAWRVAVAGALVRPLAGLAVALPLGPLLGLSPLAHGMLVLFASLPPAILNFLVAERYDQEPAKVGSIVLAGHLASLVFVPFGLWLALRPA